MTRLIQFHIPKNYPNPRKWVPQARLGKLIAFCPKAKKSA